MRRWVMMAVACLLGALLSVSLAMAQRTHTVASGETLSAIARQYGVTVTELAAANGITNPDRIFVGQVLTIPGDTPGGGQGGTGDSEPLFHIVQPGDTLNRIALRYGVSAQQIITLNNLLNPDLIFVGQQLVIRQGTPPAGPTPSPGPGASPTPVANLRDVIIADTLPNLFANPGFEGAGRSVAFSDVVVSLSWEPFYCDVPYTDAKCPAALAGSANPSDLVMGRALFRTATAPIRIRSGQSAQEWQCTYQSCRAGVYQTVTTVPGAACEVAAYVQTWSAADGDYKSDVATLANRDQSQWFIRVDLQGDTDAYGSSVLVSRPYTYRDGHYDQFARIRVRFRPQGTATTIFFENLRVWPMTNSASFIDDVYFRCTG